MLIIKYLCENKNEELKKSKLINDTIVERLCPSDIGMSNIDKCLPIEGCEECWQRAIKKDQGETIMETQAKRNVVRDYCNNTACSDCELRRDGVNENFDCLNIESATKNELDIALDIIQKRI